MFIAELIAAMLLQLGVQAGAHAVVKMVTTSSAVIIVDCTEPGAQAKAIEATRQAERKSGKKVAVECAKPILTYGGETSAAVATMSPTAATPGGSDTDAP